MTAFNDEFLVRNNLTKEDLKNHRSNELDDIWSDSMYQEYLDKIFSENPWLTDEQRSYLQSNPRLRSVMPVFQPNWFQRTFGGTTAENRYYADMKTSAIDWASEVLEGFRQEYYNSPVNQVGRRSAAGLNSDLDTGAVSSGMAAENDESVTGVPNMSDYQELSEVSQLGVNIIQTAFQFYSGFMNVRSLNLDNMLKSFSLKSGLRDSALNIIKDGMSEFINGNMMETVGTDWDKPRFVKYVSKYYADRLDKLPYSRKEKKMLLPVLESMITGSGEGGGVSDFTNIFQQVTNGSFTDLFDSRAAVAESSGKIGSDKETISALSFMGKEIYRPLNELNLDIQKLLLQKDKGYLSRFMMLDENGLTGAQLQADSDKFGYSVQRDLFNVKKRILDAFEQINYKITGSFKLSEGWKLALQAGVASAESLFMTQLNQGLHFSYGANESHLMGKNGVSNSSGVRWSF